MKTPEEKLSRWRKQLLAGQIKLVGAVYRTPGKILLGVLAVSIVASFFTVKLFQDVRTDFATLLPENDRSVVHVKEATERTGGVGNIFVSIYSPDFEANKKFAQAYAALLEKYPKDLVKFFDYNTRDTEQFFKDRLFYYLGTEELKELRSTLRKRLEKTRLSAFGMDLEESNPDAQLKKVLKKIFDKYKGENPFGFNKEGYFTDKTGENVAMIIRPTGDAADQKFSEAVVSRLQADIAKLDPKKFHPQMEVGLAGTYVALLQNFASIIQDTVETAALTIFLVLGSIYLYYRSLRMVLMLCAGVLVGILLTFAVTYFRIGYLNQQTAFLASIIVGNGINFGLILMARYLEERGHGTSFRRSYNRAIFYTISATFMAAFATSISYSILSVTTFRGFSQFGFIGGIGMVLCWAALTLIIPCFLVLFERWRPQKVSKIHKFIQRDNARKLAQVIHRNRKPLTWILYVLVPIAIAGTIIYASKDRFEYSLKKLSIKVSEGPGSEQYFMRRVDTILGNGSNASMLIAHDREDAHRTAQALEKKIADAKAAGKPLFISSVRWLDQFYPQDQQEKLAVIKDLRRLFLPKYLSMLSPQEREWGQVALKALKAEPFKTEELPEMVLRLFREVDGKIGRVVFVAASQDAVLSNILDIIQIGKEIGSSVTLAPGKTLEKGQVLFASESMIFIDILANVSSEGPIVTLICFLAVGGLIWSGFRKLKEFLIVYTFLSLGMFAFIATLQFFEVKLNFFNFITIPITIGIGVDYAINIYYRYKADHERSITDAVASTGSAVFLCSWTTIIGYGTMLWAKNQAMASFGLMAVIGEVSCLAFAMVFMPAWLGMREDRRKHPETSHAHKTPLVLEHALPAHTALEAEEVVKPARRVSAAARKKAPPKKKAAIRRKKPSA
ncbi:MAG: MMPL family transporter [Turneriella sp.]|nr:MMPL family transporter [Turneriella sp.]